ncbi:UNVERIFIED_CONTAM: regulatory protein YycI of two-component signal transduction system YycFG [Acetivibrio alkalicellulosi]
MEWSKAKSILIIIFVLLNIFLGSILHRVLSEEGISKETIDNTKVVLLNRGVIVNSDIPLYNKQVGYLTYKNSSVDKFKIVENLFDKKILTSEIEEQKKIERNGQKLLFKNEYNFIYKNENLIDNIDEVKTLKDVFSHLAVVFKNTNVPISEFEFDYIKNENTYILRQKHKGLLVFENYIAISVTSEGISYLECRYREIDGIIQGNSIVPAYQVLIKNHESIKDIEIIGIDIGFKAHGIEDEINELNDIPVWRIRISDGEQLFFRAYDGEVIDYAKNSM